MRLHECLRVGYVALNAFVAAGMGCTGGDAGHSAKAGREAASATVILKDLDDQPFEWPQRPATVTVALFTRTDCPVSNRFAPEIQRIHKAYQPRGVEFFLIYVDPRESPDTIRRHLREYLYPCVALRDPTHSLVDRCGATITPEAAVFAKDGTMTYLGRVNDLYLELGKPQAEATRHDLEDAIDATLQGRPVAAPRTRAIGCRIADVKD